MCQQRRKRRKSPQRLYDQEYKTCFNKNISGVAAEDIHGFLKKLKSGIRNQNQPPDMFCKRR